MRELWRSDDGQFTVSDGIGPREGDPPSYLHYVFTQYKLSGQRWSSHWFTSSEMERLALAIMRPHDEDVSI